MTTMSSEVPHGGLEILEVPLRSLYLDPNNLRLAHHQDYTSVPEQHVTDANVQKRTLNMLWGNGEDLQSLLDSFLENGWLPIAPILVKPLGEDRFLVVEGNRRIGVLKHLEARHASDGIDLRALDPAMFQRVPVVTYLEQDPVRYLALKGFEHVSGPKKWSMVDQATILRSLRDEHGQSPDDIRKTMGISRQQLNLMLRALRLYDVYRQSDYGDQPRSDLYNLLLEAMRRPQIRGWLGWNDSTDQAGNEVNVERLFRWLSGDKTEAEGSPRREPAITTFDQIRDFATLLDDPQALDRLDRTHNLALARGARASLDACESQIHMLSQLAHELDDSDLDRVEQLVSQLRGVSAVRNRVPAIFQSVASEVQPFNQLPTVQFTEITIERYRGLSRLTLADLRRVNIFAGVNNAGKTTVLEAVHLLADQHDVTGLLDVIRSRSRVAGDPDPQWLVQQIPRSARISGTFDRDTASVELTFNREADVEDQAFYLGTLTLAARYGAKVQRSATTFYEKRDRRTHVDGIGHILCRSFLSSPFSLNDPNLLVACNRRSVETRSKERILDFLRSNVDGGLVNIEMVDKFQRFLVTHRELEQGLDLTHFGDGMQRVFLTCLLFSWAEHGVLLLDEFENAIHAALLRPLAAFVVELAKQFEVQVFVASHSREAIDAFVGAGLGEDLAGYRMTRKDNVVTVHRFDGTRLARLRDAADFDMRMQ